MRVCVRVCVCVSSREYSTHLLITHFRFHSIPSSISACVVGVVCVHVCMRAGMRACTCVCIVLCMCMRVAASGCVCLSVHLCVGGAGGRDV